MSEVSWFENTELSYAEFMLNNWRKRPAVFEKGLESISQKLSSELIYNTIVDISSSDHVESRTIQQATDKYHLAFGPFSKDEISTTLSNARNMLMVQGTDQHIPSLSELLTNQFGFLPRWRIEDIMVTIGGSGASCGPHFDHYDVFLFQLRGEKHWQWDARRHEDEELDVDSDLRLLPSFDPEFSQTMGLGDVLYLPPGAGHWGIAGPDSMTLSIGIRNPTMIELVSNYTDELLDDHLAAKDNPRTLDDTLDPSNNALSGAMIDELHTRYLSFVSNRERMSHWFGRYMTELKEPDLIRPMEQSVVEHELAAHRLEDAPFRLTLPSRITHQDEFEPLQFFLNGEMFSLDLTCIDIINQLSRTREVAAKEIFGREESLMLMKSLMLNGAIQFMGAAQECA